MTMQPEANLPEPDPLQFDHAEFSDVEATSTATITCAGCRKPIADRYYEINGVTLCEACRNRIEGQFRGGSGFFCLIKATVFGSAGAIAGAAVYFAVLYFLHIQAGLVGILCSYLVGMAVRKGSEGRGGWIYQILAVGLTYLAIGLAMSSNSLASGEIDDVIAQNVLNNPQGQPMDVASIKIAKVIWFVVLIFASPVIVGISNIISAVIILFSLLGAWRYTKKVKVVVTGPYRVGESDPGIDPSGLAAHA